MAFLFEKLNVYQKSVDLADRVCEVTEGFPARYRFLSDQLCRASVSVAANIAEGNGRATARDKRNFLTVARGSAQECVPLLELARRRALIGDDVHGELAGTVEEIARMVSALIQRVEKEMD